MPTRQNKIHAAIVEYMRHGIPILLNPIIRSFAAS